MSLSVLRRSTQVDAAECISKIDASKVEQGNLTPGKRAKSGKKDLGQDGNAHSDRPLARRRCRRRKGEEKEQSGNKFHKEREIISWHQNKYMVVEGFWASILSVPENPVEDGPHWALIVVPSIGAIQRGRSASHQRGRGALAGVQMAGIARRRTASDRPTDFGFVPLFLGGGLIGLSRQDLF